jgi:hypothetical protein
MKINENMTSEMYAQSVHKKRSIIHQCAHATCANQYHLVKLFPGGTFSDSEQLANTVHVICTSDAFHADLADAMQLG